MTELFIHEEEVQKEKETVARMEAYSLYLIIISQIHGHAKGLVSDSISFGCDMTWPY